MRTRSAAPDRLAVTVRSCPAASPRRRADASGRQAGTAAAPALPAAPDGHWPLTSAACRAIAGSEMTCTCACAPAGPPRGRFIGWDHELTEIPSGRPRLAVRSVVLTRWSCPAAPASVDGAVTRIDSGARAWRTAVPVVAAPKPAAVAADAAATTTVRAVTAKASRYPATWRTAAGSLGMSSAVLRALPGGFGLSAKL